MRLALVALACTGCSLGAGSAFVGQWRPRTEHAFVACLEDDQGRCKDKKAVDVAVPPRKFFGYIVSFPAIGAAIVEKGGKTNTRFRMEYANELVRGHGVFAWGVRASLLLDWGAQTSLNVMGLGYLSLTERLALHVGLGYSPFSRSSSESGAPSEDAFIGGRALAGLQFALTRTRSENYLILSLDVDRMYIAFDDAVAATGIVGNLGIYF